VHLCNFPVISLITCLPGKTPKLCTQRAENSQNFWVGGMPPGYSRESWCSLPVPEKTMFGRTFNVGLDPFLRYPGLHALAAGRGWFVAASQPRPAMSPVTAHGGWPWPAVRWLRLATAACGRVLAIAGRCLAGASCGTLRPATGRGRLRRAMAGLWLAMAGQGPAACCCCGL